MRIPAQVRKEFLKKAIANGCKVLTYDTETSHMLVRTFYIGQKVSIQHRQIKVPSKVITIQYKWAHEKQARYLEWDRVNDKYDDTRNFDDSAMIQEFATNILTKADIVVTQNGDKFDLLTLNERAKALQLPAILDFKPSIDILKLSRKSFKSASHKLDYRSEQQGLGGKIRMVDDDWVDVEENNVPVTKKMVPYGLKDSVDTEKLLWKELEYYKDLPIAVEKVILSFLNLPKKEKSAYVYTYVPRPRSPTCTVCRSKHRPSKDVSVLKNGNHYCNNCKSEWNTND